MKDFTLYAAHSSSAVNAKTHAILAAKKSVTKSFMAEKFTSDQFQRQLKNDCESREDRKLPDTRLAEYLRSNKILCICRLKNICFS